jgi:CNT family concentrative nucleoside transporter
MLQPILGIVVLIGFAWIISESRRKVKITEVLLGLFITVLMAVVMLKIPYLRIVFDWLNRGVSILEESTKAGTSFVFGYLGGGALPFDEKSPGSSFVFALQSLPIVLVVSALSSLLFYWRILPLIVRVFAWLFEKTMPWGVR